MLIFFILIELCCKGNGFGLIKTLLCNKLTGKYSLLDVSLSTFARFYTLISIFLLIHSHLFDL